MTTMDQIHRIRTYYYEQGKNLSEIAALMNLDWRTVRKYVDMEDFNPAPPAPEKEVQHTSKLNNFKPLIDSWLEADLKAPRKQRHTAKRIHRRLQKEASGYDCSYRLLVSYVTEKKKELRLSKEEGALPLNHFPGEAQADFGTADFYENGKLHHEAKYLVLSFPYSNGGYLQLNYGENMECLLEGLVAIFEYIGGVPTEIWFDNTRTIVTDIIKGGGRNVTERFQRFAEHYRFKPVFMNPDAGWEKGNVRSLNSRTWRSRTPSSFRPVTWTWSVSIMTMPRAALSLKSSKRIKQHFFRFPQRRSIHPCIPLQGPISTESSRWIRVNTATPHHLHTVRMLSGWN